MILTFFPRAEPATYITLQMKCWYLSTKCHIPEDQKLGTHPCENFNISWLIAW